MGSTGSGMRKYASSARPDRNPRLQRTSPSGSCPDISSPMDLLPCRDQSTAAMRVSRAASSPRKTTRPRALARVAAHRFHGHKGKSVNLGQKCRLPKRSVTVEKAYPPTCRLHESHDIRAIITSRRSRISIREFSALAQILRPVRWEVARQLCRDDFSTGYRANLVVFC